MSSVTRFIRQVPNSTAYYTVNASVLAGTNLYEFQPTAANYVGNYPPGFMVVASGVAADVACLATAGTALTLVLRDMGKTIYAQITNSSGDAGWFRQVQVLKPTGITAAQGFIGGTSGQNFGVLGAASVPNGNTDYFTFYVAVPVAGVLPAAFVTGALSPIAGGQL
ncbi:MAG: hypothetical protein EBQ66_01790 [Flavobacteriia bacterium]|nr:hypothetical protein [Flavobacteriia bacterium]